MVSPSSEPNRNSVNLSSLDLFYRDRADHLYYKVSYPLRVKAVVENFFNDRSNLRDISYFSVSVAGGSPVADVFFRSTKSLAERTGILMDSLGLPSFQPVDCSAKCREFVGLGGKAHVPVLVQGLLDRKWGKCIPALGHSSQLIKTQATDRVRTVLLEFAKDLNGDHLFKRISNVVVYPVGVVGVNCRPEFVERLCTLLNGKLMDSVEIGLATGDNDEVARFAQQG